MNSFSLGLKAGIGLVEIEESLTPVSEMRVK